jgi:hypothetical protein
VEVQRHERVAALLDLADQFLDFLAVQQQLARANRVGRDVGRSLGQRADMGTDQEDLGVLDHDVTFPDLAAPGAQRLDFPALQHEPRLVAFLDVIIEVRFPVVDDAHERIGPTRLKSRF